MDVSVEIPNFGTCVICREDYPLKYVHTRDKEIIKNYLPAWEKDRDWTKVGIEVCPFCYLDHKDKLEE